MPRARVQPTDLVTAIVTALNNATVQGGVLKAKANGNEVTVQTHSDSTASYPEQYSIFVH